MKTRFVFLTMSILSSHFVHAETLISLSSDPGYVVPANYYSKDCKIDTEGNLKYTYSKTINGELQIVKSNSKKISSRDLGEITALIAEIRTTPKPYPHYNDYGGDTPDFTLIASPDSPTELFGIHYHGTDLTHTSSGKKILHKVSHACGMAFEIFKLKWEASHNA